MLRRILGMGVVSSVCFIGMCEPSEAGHRHRRARQNASQNCCVAAPEPECQAANPYQHQQVLASPGNCGCQQQGMSSYGSNYLPATNAVYSPMAPTNEFLGGRVNTEANAGAVPLAAGTSVNIGR